MGKEITAGVGTRYGAYYPLDSDGLPSVAVTTAVPQQGTLISGIMTATINDPAPQRFTHYGQDHPYAQDQLPPTEGGTMTVTSGDGNMVVDAMAEGIKTRQIGNSVWKGVNTDKRGSEPLLGSMFYRQALDTTPGSATFGQLRQWNITISPSARWAPASAGMAAGKTAKTLNGTPTPTGKTIWGESYNETSWGHSTAEYTEGNGNYQPRLNWWLGNGTLAAFQLSHPPAASDELLVWNAGTLLSPSAVNTSSTNPAFTLASPPVGKVIGLIFTDKPGNN
jgi:hypothetical protein